MNMNEPLTDKYVRDELSPAEADDFELRLFESPDLQDELEEVLILKKALKLDISRQERRKQPSTAENTGNSNWVKWALAASVTLLVVSSYFHLSSFTETSLLRDQIVTLGEPRSDVLFATVSLKRSSSNSVPETVIQLSDQHSKMYLEIELGGRSRNDKALLFSIENKDKQTLLTWSGSPDIHGFARVILSSEQMPTGFVWLVVSSMNGETLERRFLEVRESE